MSLSIYYFQTFVSCVEISHISKLIKLSVTEVEKKLAHMILDRKFSGILDQGQGTLIVYENEEENVNFQQGLDIIANMGQVVETMKGRGGRLTQLKNADGKGVEKEKGKEKEKEPSPSKGKA